MILLLPLLFALQARTSDLSTKAVSVCEVLANDPTKRNGRVIKVRGILDQTDEGVWLNGECKDRLVTKGIVWGNNLSVYVDWSDASVSRSWARMGVQARETTRRCRPWQNMGYRRRGLETRRSMNDEVLETLHGLVKIGFGHLGGSPAENQRNVG